MTLYIAYNTISGEIHDYREFETMPEPNSWVALDANSTISEFKDAPAIVKLNLCHMRRAKEYPSLADFADAYVHAQNGDTTQMSTYVAACNAVKARYPKP